MTAPLEGSEKRGCVLVECQHGDPDAPSYARYTDWSQDVSGPGPRDPDTGSPSVVVYTSTPALEVRPIRRTGTFDEPPVQIYLPLDTWSDRLSAGEPHSPVYVRVLEAHETADGRLQDVLVLHAGRLARTVRNPGGRTSTVLLESTSMKAELSLPLGLPANHLCVWTLGGRGCRIDLEPQTQPGVLASITGSGKDAAITGLPLRTGRFWQRGYLEHEGLRIGIQDWIDTSPTRFILRDQPPADWIGDVVSVIPGCDKSIETCRSRWANEARFGGFGYAMPPYDPTYETA